MVQERIHGDLVEPSGLETTGRRLGMKRISQGSRDAAMYLAKVIHGLGTFRNHDIVVVSTPVVPP